MNSADAIFYREGYAGNWIHVTGALKQVTVGKLGVFGVNPNDQIFYRTGTMEDPKSAGSGWQHLPGALKYISSGKSTIWGVNSADQIFYMKNLKNNNGILAFEWIHVAGGLKQISCAPGTYKLLPIYGKNRQLWNPDLKLNFAGILKI